MRNRKIDAQGIARQFHFRASQAYGEIARRPVREDALVDIGERLAPAIQELDGIITVFDFRNGDDGATGLVNGDPSLGISDVQVRIGPVNRTRLPVDQLVPLETFLEVELLLSCDQETAEKIDIGLADLFIAELAGLC